jgi:PhnB protein
MPDVKPIPDGYPRVIPYLHVSGADAAIEFYKRVLGAEERMRMPGPEGKVSHAELEIGDGSSCSRTSSRIWMCAARRASAARR